MHPCMQHELFVYLSLAACRLQPSGVSGITRRTLAINVPQKSRAQIDSSFQVVLCYVLKWFFFSKERNHAPY